TEFETPTGVASVRGTQGSISFVIDTLTATYVLNEGLLSHDGNVYSFDLGAGLIISIQTTRGAAGQILTTINVLEGNATIITTAGIEIGLDAGDTVGITTYIDESGNPTGIENIEQTSGNSTIRTNTGTTNLATGNIVTITVQGGIEKINIEEGIIDFTNNDGDSTTIRPDDPPIQNTLPEPPAAGPGDPENPLLPMPVPTTTNPAAEVPQNLADEAEDEPEDPGTPTGPAG
ncbi:MAG: hypothetical protein GY808_16130, partial [Gammaproteobacteria bacterium]|nr:hypothetical protein [Gammaproteobacteria bacterium]